MTDPGVIALAANEVHLWLVFCDEIEDETLRYAYRNLLVASEREQEARFHFAKDRHRYLVTRALVRTVLSRYVAIDPEKWRFAENVYGRPEIVNDEAKEDRLSFNISHTQGAILLGVTRHRSLGVDVENLVARDVSIDIAHRFFASEEVAVLTRAPACEQQYRFFEYWTLKEAYIKARGLGLSLPLDKFSFHYPGERTVRLNLHAELNDDPERWRFWQFRPRPEYLVAVCAEQSSELPLSLTVREAIPLKSEKVFYPEISRVSP